MALSYGVILFSPFFTGFEMFLKMNFGRIVYNLYPTDIENKTKIIKRACFTLI